MHGPHCVTLRRACLAWPSGCLTWTSSPLVSPPAAPASRCRAPCPCGKQAARSRSLPGLLTAGVTCTPPLILVFATPLAALPTPHARPRPSIHPTPWPPPALQTAPCPCGTRTCGSLWSRRAAPPRPTSTWTPTAAPRRSAAAPGERGPQAWAGPKRLLGHEQRCQHGRVLKLAAGAPMPPMPHEALSGWVD